MRRRSHSAEQIRQGVGQLTDVHVSVEIAERFVNFGDVERRRRVRIRIDVAENLTVLDLGPGVADGGVLKRLDQLVGPEPAAVLGRPVTVAVGAYHIARRGYLRLHRLQPQNKLPVVAEVVAVEHPIADVGQHLVQANLLLGYAHLAAAHLEIHEVVLGVVTVIDRATAESVQMAVGPAEGYLDDLVQVVQKHARRNLQPPPRRRCGACQIDPDLVGHHVRAPGAAARRWPRSIERVDHRSPRPSPSAA